MNNIEEIKTLIEEKTKNINTLEELQNIKNEFMGKNGHITEVQKMIKEIPNEEKKEFGAKVNEVRNLFNTKYEEIKKQLEEAEINRKLEKEAIDITLPSEKIGTGSLHPFNRIIEEVEDLFVSMGYYVVDGPEVETY